MSFPTGRPGQALALALTILAGALLWLAVAVPLLEWNAGLAETRASREALATRTQTLADNLPALRQRATASSPTLTATLPGDTDAVAAAALQSALQDMAAKAGITLSSIEQLPPGGATRRIGLRVVVSGRYSVLIGFLAAIDSTTPRLLIDDLSIQRGPVLLGADNPLAASFAVYGFRAAPI